MSIRGCLLIGGLASTATRAEPVATVSGHPITAESMVETAAKEGFDLAIPTQRTNALQQAITFATFAEEAKAQGYFDRPEVKQAAERIAVDLLIREKVDKQLGPTLNDEKELRAYYDSHPEEFSKPATAKLRIIEIYSNPEKPEEAEAKAASVTNRLQEGVSFEQLAAALCSHPEAKRTGGISTWVVQDRSSKRYPVALLNLAFALKVGAVTPPVKSGNTWYLAKLEALTPAVVSPYDQVKMQIARNLQRQKRLALYKDYVKKLQDKYPVVLNEKALAALAPTEASTNLPPMGPVRVSPITFSDPDGPPKAKPRMDATGRE